MRIHHLLAVPTALAFLLAAATSNAQDKPTSGAEAKPKTGTPLKPAKSATQTPLQRNAVKPKTAKEGTVAKKIAPAAVQSMPAEERKESSCHSRESDA